MPLRWRQESLCEDDSEIHLWNAPTSEFSCGPDAIRNYIDGERWDLVFNALCHLSGVVQEGDA